MTSHKNLFCSRFIYALAVLAALFVFASCGRSQPEAEAKPPAGSTVLVGAGATFPSVLYNRWFAAYQGSHPNVFVRYAAVGSGEGVRRFIGKNISEKEKVDFGASDAAMNDADIANAGGDVLMIPVTAGCVVLAYNLPGLQEDLKLSRRAYSGIFLGEIRKWDDPLIAQANPELELPASTIVTAVRQDGSGTTFAFTKHLDAVSEKWRGRFGAATLVDWPGDAMRGKGNEGVASLIGNSVGAIGYVGYEFAQKLGLKTALLENKEGKFVKPSERACGAALAAAELPDNLRAFVPDPKGADSYPIVTFSWILVRKKYATAETAEAVRDLFRWSLTEGQHYAPELGYVRIPSSVAVKARAALDSIQAGG